MSRFVVTELEGYPIGHGGVARRTRSAPALSCSVLDSAYCYVEVARFRSEDQRSEDQRGFKGAGRGFSRAQRFGAARSRARGLAAMLEAEHAL